MCRHNRRGLGTTSIYKTAHKHLWHVMAEMQSVLSSNLRKVTMLGPAWAAALCVVYRSKQRINLSLKSNTVKADYKGIPWDLSIFPFQTAAGLNTFIYRNKLL